MAQWLAGAGPRLIGQRLGVAADTVRGWVRRVVRRADQLRGAATVHLHLLDSVAVPPEPTGSDLGDALAALAVATQAATTSSRTVSRWRCSDPGRRVPVR
jgi:hypothetical protein